MIPWPIAILTLCYGAMAAASAATVWKISAGLSQQPIGWPLVWFAWSSATMCGLPLLKPWARWAAILGSLVLMISTLAVAGMLVLAHRPLAALLATFGAAVHVLIIRYLQRPIVKEYFGMGSAECGMKSEN